MDLYKKCTAKPYSLLMIYATLASGNPLCFVYVLKRTWKLTTAIDDKVRDEKLNEILIEKQQKYLPYH